jgi:P4 family phage/plasmid primase-like protien
VTDDAERAHRDAEAQRKAQTGRPWISSKGKVLVDEIVKEVDQRVPLATDEGGELWHYDVSGVWKPRGAQRLTLEIADMLGGRFTTGHVANARAIIESRPPKIGDVSLPGVVNCESGLLDWQTGTLEPHDHRLYSTSQIPVTYDPSATCPTVDQYLDEVFPAGAVPLAWEILGYGLYDGNPLHIAILLDGRGRNGKGTFLRLATRLYGVGNVSTIPLQALDENRFAAAHMYGKMANIAGDLDARHMHNTSLFKQVTGEDRIFAERKYGHGFEFTARAFPIFAANETPTSSDASTGFLDRWIVVPFSSYFPEGKRDLTIEDRMALELPGVLNKAIAALQGLMSQGKWTIPPLVKAAKDEFDMHVDPVRAFLSERVVASPEDWVSRTETYRTYRSWAEQNGLGRLSAKRFNKRVLEASRDVLGGATSIARRDGIDGWRGIRLRAGEGRTTTHVLSWSSEEDEATSETSHA